MGGRLTQIAVLMAAGLVACAGGGPRSATGADTGGARVTVTRPTVVAYFVIPNGVVDTLPGLAVEADDWNVAMATLRDSLEASGIDLAMVTDSTVRVAIRGRRDTTLALGSVTAAGYVFVRPDGTRCVWSGGRAPDSVTAQARSFAQGGRCA